MIAALLATGRKRRFRGAGGAAFTTAAAAIAVGVIYANIFAIPDPLILGILFVCSLFSLLFLAIGARPGSPELPSAVDWLLALASIATGIWFFINADNIANRITLLDELTHTQIAFGSVLLFLSLEATRRTTGAGLTSVVAAFMLYNLFGHLLPPPFGHGVIDYPYLLDILIYTTDGVFGVPIQVVASYVFLFVMFGTFLSLAGGGEFFFNIAAALAGRQAGGPAKVAVISSGLYGMISGSPTSDVVATGSITIPVMKRLGYAARFAGAVEVAASTGGSALPPIMGSAAFILSEYTGIEYRDVAVAAILPALLYYLGVFSQVHFRARRRDLKPYSGEELPTVAATLRRGWIYLIPISVIVSALFAGYSPSYVAAGGVLAVVLATALTRRTRMSPLGIVQALGETTLRVLPVAGACAAAGLVIGGLSMTGLAMKTANLILYVSGDATLLAMLIAALVTIVLGLGMPTPSAYILAAVLIGPVFGKLGLPLLESHLFLLYFALLSALTPPIAVAAMAASAIADENPFLIAFDAVKLAAAGFLLPFAFIWNPAFIGHGDLPHVVLAAVGGAAAVICLSAALEGYAGGPLGRPVRFALAGFAAAAAAPRAAVVLPALAGLAAAVWYSRRASAYAAEG